MLTPSNIVPAVERRPYRTLGDFLRAAEAWVNFYNRERPHESLDYRSTNQFAEINQLQTLPYLTLLANESKSREGKNMIRWGQRTAEQVQVH